MAWQSSNPNRLTHAHTNPVALAANTAATVNFKPLIIDSGCTVHMVGDISLFSSFDPTATKRPISVAGGAQTVPSAIGTVKCTVLDVNGNQQHLELTNVSYAPSSPFNLISVSRLLEDQQCSNPDFASRTWDLGGPGVIPL